MREPIVRTLSLSQGRVVCRRRRRNHWRRTWLLVLVGCLAVSCVGCAGLITPSGPSKRATQAMIERNLKNLRRLQVGMFEEYVADVMGKPQRVEIYAWGTSWLYRTAMADGAGGVAESDLTPLVFDDRGVLLGWGQSFLAQQMKRHE